MRILFLIIFICFFSSVNAAEETIKQNQSQVNKVEVEQFSDKDLLNKAKSLRRKNPTESLKLANQALELSLQKDNVKVTAQVYTLLGKLAQQAKNNEQALAYFLQASVIHKSINNTGEQITASADYINLLLSEKHYQQADDSIVKLLPIAEQYKKAWPLALTLILKADSYYFQKNYKLANREYKLVTKLLTASDKRTQRTLGQIYKKLAQSYKRLKDRKQTAAFYKKALDVFTKLKDKKNMARTLNTLAEAERYLKNYFVALDYSIQGIEIHKTIKDPEGRAKALTGAGIIYRHIERYEKSLEHIYEAHLYYKKTNNISGIAKTSNQMGLLYTRLSQFEQARSFYQLTIDLPKEKVTPRTLASALREMAVIDLNSKNYESAMKLIQQANKININNKENESLTFRIIGNIYKAQNNEIEAINSYRKSLSIATKIGHKVYQMKAQVLIGRLIIGKNTTEAISLLQKALTFSIQLNMKPYQLSAYRELRKAEKSKANFGKALRYAEQELRLSKEIKDEKNDEKFVLIKAKLYSHKKEMELAELREKVQHDQLELVKKNNEIEIAEKTRIITELQLTKNEYASLTLALLLAISVLLLVLMFRLFRVSKKRNKELDSLAERDPLTNCYNRRGLFVRMSRDFEKPELLTDYCIIVADIDHFKSVNDTYGHSVGDSVICNVANILQSSVRKNDMVVRLGGEEFCIVLYNMPLEKASYLAEEMRNKIEVSNINDISVTCSFGITSIKFNAESPAELINQADLALYQSKSLGRNKVTMWSEGLEKEL